MKVFTIVTTSLPPRSCPLAILVFILSKDRTSVLLWRSLSPVMIVTPQIRDAEGYKNE